MENKYLSRDMLINNLSKKERLNLKQSLLGKTIRILVDDKYGLFTEHGFPVALATYDGKLEGNPKEFFAKVISVEPMVTIYEIQ